MEWNFTREDAMLVDKIVKMAADRAPTVYGTPSRQTNLRMDLLAVHSNGNPMDFRRMAAALEVEYILHDLTGITINLDRNTGTLKDCFTPRFSKVKSK